MLKQSIGKDLPKTSFPVFFDEPTSILQRMVSVFSDGLWLCWIGADGHCYLGGGYGVF